MQSFCLTALLYELRLPPEFSRQVAQVAFHEGGIAGHVLRHEAEEAIRNFTNLRDRVAWLAALASLLAGARRDASREDPPIRTSGRAQLNEFTDVGL